MVERVVIEIILLVPGLQRQIFPSRIFQAVQRPHHGVLARPPLLLALVLLDLVLQLHDRLADVVVQQGVAADFVLQFPSLDHFIGFGGLLRRVRDHPVALHAGHEGAVLDDQHVVAEQDEQDHAEHEPDVGTKHQGTHGHQEFAGQDQHQPVDFARFEVVVQHVVLFAQPVGLFGGGTAAPDFGLDPHFGVVDRFLPGFPQPMGPQQLVHFHLDTKEPSDVKDKQGEPNRDEQDDAESGGDQLGWGGGEGQREKMFRESPWEEELQEERQEELQEELQEEQQEQTTRTNHKQNPTCA